MSVIIKDNKFYDTTWDMYVDEFDDYKPDENIISNKLYPNEWLCEEFNTGYITLASKPKIKNGSKITIGGKSQAVVIYNTDQHFNWFQKLMWKWCFGIKVEDYSEE